MFKKTKSALALGILAIVLCMGMLVGTTYAWFTDSVESGSNVITAGNLDLKVEYTLDGENWKDLDGAEDLFQNDLWEPGHTEVVALKVTNVGSLALKYSANMGILNETIGTNKDGEDIVLSEILTVGTLVQEANQIGEIALQLAFQNENMYKGTTPFNANNVIISNQELLPGSAHYVIIKVDMAETVGNEANAKDQASTPSIEFGIDVLAAQFAYEEDSFGKDYDKDTVIPTTVFNVNELKEAVTKGGKYILGANLTIDADTDKITVPSGVKVELDLNGKKIKATANNTGNQELFLVKGNMTVVNGALEFTAENNQGWGAMATIFDVTAGGVLNLENVKASVSGTDMNFIVHLNNWGSATLNVNNCDFTATYVAIRAFNSGYDMNTVTVKNTDFHNGRMFWVHNYTSEGKDDSTLTLDIYGNNNTSDNEKPVRFGFSSSVYYDVNGNQIN